MLPAKPRGNPDGRIVRQFAVAGELEQEVLDGRQFAGPAGQKYDGGQRHHCGGGPQGRSNPALAPTLGLFFGLGQQ